jgi:hypothetical protein
MFFQNVGSHKIYTAPYPRKRHSSTLNYCIIHSVNFIPFFHGFTTDVKEGIGPVLQPEIYCYVITLFVLLYGKRIGEFNDSAENYKVCSTESRSLGC